MITCTSWFARTSTTVLASMLLVGCTLNTSKILDRRPDYRSSTVEDPLELPPDLTSSTIDDTLVVPELNPTGSATYSDYASERSGSAPSALSEAVLRQPEGIQLERSGDLRWLSVKQSPDDLWPRLKAFWTSNGFNLAAEDPRIGIMETDWAENRADIPDGPLRRVLGSVVDFAYSAATRDKFRLRVERLNEESEIYLTHYGVEEVIQGEPSAGARGQQARTSGLSKWQSRPSDSELEAEMLNRLMVYLGASERRAAAQLAAVQRELPGDNQNRVQRGKAPNGQDAVLIKENYSDAWRLVGLALDGDQFLVQDQNRSEGRYVVEYFEESVVNREGNGGGLLSSLAFWRGDERSQGERYQVRLSGQGEQTLVVVQGPGGQPARSNVAQLILNTLVSTIN